MFDGHAARAVLGQALGKAPTASTLRLTQNARGTEAALATTCFVAAAGPSMIAVNRVAVALNVSCGAPVDLIQILIGMGRDGVLVAANLCTTPLSPAVFLDCVAPNPAEVNCVGVGHVFQGVARVRVFFLSGEPRFIEAELVSNPVQINCII